MKYFTRISAAVFAVIFAGHASAQRFWAGAGLNPATSGSGTWDNANMQWSSTFPAYTAATWDSNIANFNGTGGGTVTIGDSISVNDINFGANAGAFTLLNSGGFQTIDILGAGITNNSANTQTITNSGHDSATQFSNSATAANATITNSGVTSATLFFNSATAANATITNSGVSSRTVFLNSATAANATITNSGSGSSTQFINGATAANASITNSGGGSATAFGNSATAANATITNSGDFSNTVFNNFATAANASITNSGLFTVTQFNNSATAANATITNSGDISSTVFNNSATAANATITNSGSSSFTAFNNSATAANAIITNSGSSSFTAFADSASGGNATLINANPTAQIDISGLSTTGTTAGSIAGNGFLNLGSKNLAVGSNNTSTTFSGVIRDGGFSGGVGGSLTKVGTGALTLSGTNTYSGGTTINDGVLVVDSVDALGTGNVFLSDGTLQTRDNNPRGFNVGGNYSQDFGTLRIQIGGTSAGANSDLMVVGGTTTFSMGDSSTLFLHRIFNFNPLPGEMVTIIEVPNSTITTTFDHVTNDFPGLIQPIVVYNPNTVTVDFELSAPFVSQALTPNQIAVGNAVDQAFADLCLSRSVLGVLGSIPPANLPHAFDAIAPEEFAAIYEMSFSRATVQSGNLQGRMDQIRANADPNCGPIVEINPPEPEGKNVVGKNVMPPAPAPVPDNRLGTFAMGSGDYVTVHNGDENADGYRITNGSFLAGVDYRLLHNLAIGVYGGYVGSEGDLAGRGRIVTDGETAGGYATFFSHGFYLQAAGGGGWNRYDNLRAAFLGTAHSTTNGSEVNAMGALGYDWSMNFNAANHPGSLTVGPIASVQYTNVDIDGFRERGSLIPLEFPGQSEDSVRSTIGGKAAICIQIDHGIMLRPEVRVAWLHEYNDRAYPIDARFVGCDDLFTVHGPRIGEDAAQVRAGLTVQFNPMVSLFAHYDGLFARDNYDSNGVSGGLALSF